MMKTLLAVLLLAFGLAAGQAADGQTVKVVGSPNRAYTVVATNIWLVRDVQARVYDITINNPGATDLYLMIFDTNGVPANGSYPHYTPAKVPAGQDRSYFFTGGCNFTNGLVLAASTTPVTLTNATGLLIGISYDPQIR